MPRRQLVFFAMGLGVSAALLLAMHPVAESGTPKSGVDAKEAQKMVDKAIGYLKTSQQENGGFSPKFAGPGVTALVTAALIRNGVSMQEPVVANSLKYLEKNMKDDGGIYDKGFANYTTAIAIMALKEGNQNGKYDAAIKKAADFIKNIQHNDKDDHLFGGFGYDKGGRGADMSNTGFSVEALLAAGFDKNDPAIKNALKFIGQCQNLPGETNSQAWAKKTTDDDKGGIVYEPSAANDPKSKHRTAAGGLRSLGGMTYGGLKSFLYAGVAKDDPRVKAAVDWCRNHYTLEENPGLGKSGLYYYYHTFAKALDALGEDPFVDAKGTKHNWRQELFDTLQKQQLANGSWRNQGERTFGEDNADIATAFALLSLSYTKATKR